MQLRRYALAACSVLLAAVPQAQQIPVFRAGVELLEVDVSVVDDDGEPITDLSGSDFTVSVDGDPRRIVSAQFIDLRAAATAAREAAAAGAAPGAPPAAPAVSYTANTAGDRGRLIVLAIDRESISFGEGRRAMRAASDFLDTLAPNDQVGFVTVPPPGPTVGFTTDHRLVREKLEMAVGVGRGGVRPTGEVTGAMTMSEAIAVANGNLSVARGLCRDRGSTDPSCELEVQAEAQRIVTDLRRQTMQSVWALEDLLGRLREIEGRKFVVWIAEELVSTDYAGSELFRVRSLAAAARTSVHVILLEKPTLDASTSFFGLPRGMGTEDRHVEQLGLQLMADFTGGTVNPVISNAEHAFERIGREIAGYYLLGVEPLEDDLDGSQHEIDVSVQRPGANVRARREVVHRSAGDRAEETVEERLRRVLGSPVASADLPLRVATYTYREADSGRVRVLIAADVERAPADPQVTFGYLLVDEDGKIVSSGGGPAKPGPGGGPRGPRVEQFDRLVVDPGRYTLKLAAVETGGRHGSLAHALDASRTTERPFALGDLMLAAGVAGEAAAVLPSVEARLADGRLMTYLELYADDPAGLDDVEARIDVAGSPAGPALVSQAREPQAMAGAAGAGAASVSTVMRVDALPPGPYVARAVVTRQGEEIGRRWRSFEIARSPARLAGYRWRDVAERPASPADPAPSAGLDPLPLTVDLPAGDRDGEDARSLADIVRPLVWAEREGRLVETGTPFTFEPSFFEGVDGRTYLPYTVTVDGGRLDGPVAALYICVTERDAPPAREATGDGPACVFEDAYVAAVATTAGAQASVSGALELPAGAYDVYTAVRNDAGAGDRTGAGGAGNRQGGGVVADRPDADTATILVAKERLTVPYFGAPELRLSSVLVGDIEALDAPLPPDRQRLEPYTIGTFRVVPRSRLSFSPREELSFLYFVHGAGPPGAVNPDLTIEYRFHRATIAGEQLFTWTEPERYNARTMAAEFDMTRGHRVVAARAMPLESFPFGSYRLEIRVTDDTSGALATRDIVFTVQPAAR